MPKTNFLKSEEALDELLQKMAREKLLEEADVASGKTHVPLPEIILLRKRLPLLQSLLRSLKRLYKEDISFYKTLKVSQRKMTEYIQHVAELSDHEWEKIATIKANAETHLKTLEKMTDTDLVQGERTKHINKRFNVSDRWLPLQ